MWTSLPSGCHSELCFTVSRKLWISPQQHEFSGNGTAGWNPSLWLWSVSHVPSSPLACHWIFQDAGTSHLSAKERTLAVHTTPSSVCSCKNPDAGHRHLSCHQAFLGYPASEMSPPGSRDGRLTGSKPFNLFFFYFNSFCWKSWYHLLPQNLHFFFFILTIFFFFLVSGCPIATSQQWPPHPAMSAFLKVGGQSRRAPRELDVNKDLQSQPAPATALPHCPGRSCWKTVSQKEQSWPYLRWCN